MRMNRGTLLLLIVSFVVIVAVLVLTINQATAPGTTTDDTPAAATPEVLFPVADASSIVRLEVRDDLTGDCTVLERASAGGEWAIDSTTPIEGDVDAAQVDGLLASLLALQGQEGFDVDELDQYGLTQPSYSVYAVAEGGGIHALHIGNRNPAGTRYYAVVEQLAAGTTRADLDEMQPILQRLDVATSLGEDNALGDAPADPTLAAMVEMMAEATDEAEREQIAATYGAIIEATNAAAGSTEEAAATTEAGAGADDAAPQATDSVDAEGEMQPLLERPDVDTSESTLEPEAMAAIDATPAAALTEEASAEATAEPVREPLLMLEGPQRIYLVNTTAVDALLAIINMPPVALPSIEPTETPLSLIPEEMTDEAPESVVEQMEGTDAEATEAP